jgi:hypothetical protein
VIALVVNLGVAPYLFVQVLYGQFIYTSSILMGICWIMVVPILMLAYSGAYLYDFKFASLGRVGVMVAAVCCLLFVTIAAVFSSNMMLLEVPEHFTSYFSHMNGSLLVTHYPAFAPRYLHMVLGAVAIGGLFVALLGSFQADRDHLLAEHARAFGLRAFLVVTAVNILVGMVYLMTLPREQMLLFMGRDMGATIAFAFGLLLTAGVMVSAWREKLALTVGHVVALLYVMVFMRSWLRSGYLREYFSLDKLQVVPQYSPMIFFFVTLLFGLVCLGWLWKKTSETLART